MSYIQAQVWNRLFLTSRLWNLCDHTFRNKLSLNSLRSKGDVELLLSARITTSPHPVYMVVEIALRALCTLREPSMSRDTSTAWSPALARGFRAVRNVHLSDQPGPSFQASQLPSAALSSQCQSTIGPQLGYRCQCSTGNRSH